MENQKDIDEAIKRMTEPIFNRVPQETIINHTLVGSSKSLSTYNLHNYRLYFSYNKSTFNHEKGSVGGRFRLVGLKNYGSETQYEHEATGSKITIKKSQVEIRYKRQTRDWHLIDNADPEEITRINEAKRQEATALFKSFVDDYGGNSDFKILNEYKLDNAIVNSLSLKQPLKLTYETDIVKKLYNEQKLEYKSEVAAKNAAHNAGLYDFSPMIAGSLARLEKADNVLNALVKQIELHLEVEARTNELLKQLIEKEKGQHGGLVGTSKTRPSPLFPSCSPPSSIRDILPEGWFE